MTRAGADVRLGRVLAMVPWIAAHDGPTIDDICRRFRVSERDLLADLNLLFMCGLYPFTPDVLIEVDVEGGRVWVRFAEYFRQPLRLTPLEGLALMSAGETLLAMPGADQDGALARAVAKLGAVLGLGGERVDVELAAAPGVLETVREAARQYRRVEIDYYSFGRDAFTTRVVEPWRVFNAEGQWYLSAWCHQAGGERLFRADRIRRATVLEATFEPPAAQHEPAVYTARPGDPLVVLDLAPAARWIAERFPNEGLESRPDGTLRVSLRVSERAWLERVLLRAGPDAVMVQGDAGIGPAAADRVLSRYRQPGQRDAGGGSGGGQAQGVVGKSGAGPVS